MAGVGEPIWTHEETLDPEANGKNKGKVQAKSKTSATKTKAKLQVRRLTARRALAATQWTEEEKTLIGEVKGKRKQGREMLRLMHNRSADEKGHHRVKRCGTDGRIWCERCGKSSNVKRLTMAAHQVQRKRSRR